MTYYPITVASSFAAMPPTDTLHYVNHGIYNAYRYGEEKHNGYKANDQGAQISVFGAQAPFFGVKAMLFAPFLTM